MKSLKRTLCLVLALVMVLGLFGIASATSFTDDNDVQYKEAVDVMTGVGAISGYTDGTFKPNGTITRAEAAKLVTYTILGATAASRLTGVTSSFTDVTVDGGYGWAIPSIEYLVKEGIINGRGDNTFDPQGNITGYEVGKMLLCALGYGAKGEYVGDKWTLNVAIDGNRLGGTSVTSTSGDNGRRLAVYSNRAADATALSAPATRQEVALYCFNTIQKQRVQYISTLDIYAESTNSLGVAKGSIATEAHGLTLNPADVTEFKEPANLWKIGTKEIGEFAQPAAVSYISAKTSAELISDLRSYTVPTGSADGTSSATTYGVFVNGKAVDASGWTSPDKKSALIDQLAANGTGAKYCGNGTAVKLYADANNQITKVIVVQANTCKVATNTASSKTVTLSVLNGGFATGATYTISAAAAPELYAKVAGLKVDDLVVVTGRDDGGSAYTAIDVAIPTQFTGKLTDVNNTTGVLTVDGKTYGAAKAISSAAELNVDGGKDATLWVDANGFVVNVKAAESATNPNFAFVVDTYSTIVNNKIVNMAKVVHTDGTVKDVPVVAAASPATTIAANKLFTVATVDAETGAYVLAELTLKAATGANQQAAAKDGIKLTAVSDTSGTKAAGKIEASDRTLAAKNNTADGTNVNYYGNRFSNSVKFIYINNKNVTVLNGVQNVTIPIVDTNTTPAPGTSPYTCSAAVEANSKTDPTAVVTAVFLPGVSPEGAADMSKLVYLPSHTANGKVTLQGADGKWKEVPTYDVFVNGEAQRLPITSTLAAGAATKFHVMAENPAVPGAYVLRDYTSTPTATALTAGNIDAAKVLDTGLIYVDSKYVTSTTAKVIDARTGADKSIPLTMTPAGLADAVKRYAAVNVTVLYDSTTGNGIQIYLNSVGGALRTVTLDKTSIASTDSKVTYELSFKNGVSSGASGDKVTIVIKATGTATEFLKKADTITFTPAGGGTATTKEIKVVAATKPADAEVEITIGAADISLAVTLSSADYT